MITISFYSYKGGVGRSLALTNLAVYLVQFGAKVVMVDLDLEAPGLQYKLRPGTPPVEIPSRGIAGLLADVTGGTALADLALDLAIDVSDLARTRSDSPVELPHADGRLLLVPAGDSKNLGYWRDVAHIDWELLFNSPERPGVVALAKLQEQLEEKYNPDVILIDSRTGITASGGVATTLLPDVVVSFLLNTPEHLDGTRVVLSAIVESGPGGRAPRVVPVLSRYTDFGEDFELEEDVPSPDFESIARCLVGIREQLVAGLSDGGSALVDEPLVLHADLALQRNEYLSFGPSARELEPRGSSPLLDDYLALFGRIVPRQMVVERIAGVREKVRQIILDRPDEAVRTLENLAALAGDEEVFIDLVKIYALRKDQLSVLSAAERLYRVYGRIVVDETISDALRGHLLRIAGHRQSEIQLTGAFLFEYWKAANLDDPALTAAVGRELVDEGPTEWAKELVARIMNYDGYTTRTLAQAVEIIAAGSPAAEKLAIDLALGRFNIGSGNPAFLRVAALASRYQDNSELASKVAEDTAFPTLPDVYKVDVLRLAQRSEEAGELLLALLSDMSPYDPEADQVSQSWFELSAINPDLKPLLAERNRDLLEYFESRRRDRRPRSARRVIPRRWP